MLDIDGFMNKLFLFFAPYGTEKEKTEQLQTYKRIINEKVTKKYQFFDYERLLKHFETSYSSMPSLDKVLNDLYKGASYQEKYSGHEGKVIKRLINGIEYEFTIVPNHWQNIKTISQLDADIRERTITTQTALF